MIIAKGKDVLRHDFHTHSLQSSCGMHTVAEILEFAAQKGVETVNICDHGAAAGRKIIFGVIADPKRTPAEVQISTGGQLSLIRLLPGIEANILDDGKTDLVNGAVRLRERQPAGGTPPAGTNSVTGGASLHHARCQRRK